MKIHLPYFWNFCCQILFCEIIFVVAFAIPPKCTERRLHRRRRCTRRRWRRRRWSLDVVVVWSTEKCSRVRKKFLQLNRRENTFAKILIAQKLQNLRFLTKKICHTMMHLSKSDTSFCSLMTTYWPMIDRLAIFDEKIIKKYSLPNPTIQIWDWKLLKTFL